MEVLLNATPRTDACGRIVGMLGVGQDITEQKQVEMEKTLLAQELQAFVGTANAPIFGIDAKGLVNEWNNKLATITGYTREEALGQDFVMVSCIHNVLILNPGSSEQTNYQVHTL